MKTYKLNKEQLVRAEDLYYEDIQDLLVHHYIGAEAEIKELKEEIAQLRVRLNR